MPAIENHQDPRFQAALESQRAALLAMPEDEIERRARLDPSAAFLIAWASAERLAVHRERLVAQFGPRAGELIDALPGIALATRQADVEHLKHERSDDLGAIHGSVLAAHRLLLTDAEALVNRGLIPERALDNARGIQGYQAALDSLQVVISVFREHWAAVSTRTPTTVADIDRAEDVAMRMSRAMSSRGPSAASIAASELRVRALSKLIATYDELRRMVGYLRFYEGDTDTIVPSFYAGRGGRKVVVSDEETDTDDDVVPPQPVTPSPVNGGGPFAS